MKEITPLDATTTDYTPYIIVVIPIVTAIIAATVAILVTRKQVYAQVVLAERMKWIDKLRTELSTVLACLDFLRYFHKVKSENKLTPRVTDQAIEYSEKLRHRSTSITLLLNPNEEDHVKLDKLLGQLAVKTMALEADLPNAKANVIALSQTILKREWERVKKGK